MLKQTRSTLAPPAPGAARACAVLVAAALLLTGNIASARISHGYTPVFTMHSATAVGNAVPRPTAIAGIYPNPFNPRVNIAFDLGQDGQVDLTVYDIAGHLVRRLDSGFKAAGRYESSWDGRDDQGRGVSTGTYFCRLSTSQGAATRKMTLAK